MPELGGSLFQPSLPEGRFGPRFHAYYYKQWSSYRMDYHSHDSTEIMYLMTGSCIVDVKAEEAREERFALKKGELILLDANVPHRLIVEEGVSCRMLNVEFAFAPAAEGDLAALSVGALAREEPALAELLRNPFASAVLPDPEEVPHTLKSLVLELDRAGGEGVMARLLFAELLLRLARLRREQLQSSRQHAHQYIRRTIEYLHQNYDRGIQVREIAAAVNLHPGYLHRLFKQHTGRTLTDYLNGLRMDKAKMLLSASAVPIADIADYVGIASRQYFHLLFRKYGGCTPTQYREQAERDSRAGSSKAESEYF
ncbi:AraC family transcriptional regulator [Saccharibacillus sp. CPCC 101409]|uniref:AraC family transcriptional regulator n=1 Tax=Saccharibacillus sp. CPCC 101409 TaxID=3058041 RepID=UPI002673E90D|nr:AraC family transcriptional regulator [Saccharibacillus sp. CPCC 101409]MDO3413042.1 AraC family transcriptional regulator [Saccharibacillus sp. CPCC 101409]